MHVCVCVCGCVCMCARAQMKYHSPPIYKCIRTCMHTGWQRCRGCLKLQVSFRKKPLIIGLFCSLLLYTLLQIYFCIVNLGLFSRQISGAPDTEMKDVRNKLGVHHPRSPVIKLGFRHPKKGKKREVDRFFIMNLSLQVFG